LKHKIIEIFAEFPPSTTSYISQSGQTPGTNYRLNKPKTHLAILIK